MKKQNINILDFKLFSEVIKAGTKIVESAKLQFSENGLEIYGCRGNLTRCELITNAVYSNENISVCIGNLATFSKVLDTIISIHGDDFSDFNFYIDSPKICFESKKFKNKYQTQNEDVISKWISKKVEKLEVLNETEFEFTTTSDLIKRIISHSFIFENSKQNELRIYLTLKNDMEKNSIYATLGNNENSLSNEITLKFGIVNFGTLPDNRKLILDLEHINLFNAIQSNEIKIILPKKYNMLISKTKILGKNDSYFNMNIYNALLKK